MTTSFPSIDDLPVGFRFKPTDEELVNHYLKNKLLGNDNIVNKAITELEFCKFEPWELPAMSKIKCPDDQEWFFVCPRVYKYAKGKRINRETKCGFWKPTGKDRNITIRVRGIDTIIGSKKTLVYNYKGRAPDGVKINWVLHEYEYGDDGFEDNQRNFVLCRLMQKTEEVVFGSSEVNMEYYLNLLASPHEDDYSFREYSFSESTDQTTYFEGLTSSNAHFKTENNNAGFPFETDQEDN